eukprot:SAG31_NODE_5250_length_2650_cov_2.135241_1_plen_164_part_00
MSLNVSVTMCVRRRLGSLKSLRGFQMLQIPVYALLPVANGFAASGRLQLMWWWVILLRSVAICCLSASFTCCAILMNNSVRIEERGALNGAGMTVRQTSASSSRACTPACSCLVGSDHLQLSCAELALRFGGCGVGSNNEISRSRRWGSRLVQPSALRSSRGR